MNNDRFNDAWIFLSIGDAGGCDRQIPPDELASWADSNNHAIPTLGELSEVLASLTKAGLVAVAGDNVAFTEAGCATYRDANTFSGGHIDRMFALANRWTGRFPPDIRSAS
jgi:hypothetical protein